MKPEPLPTQYHLINQVREIAHRLLERAVHPAEGLIETMKTCALELNALAERGINKFV
jgi:hypothetical protein